MTENDPRDYRSLGDLLRDARTERKLTLEAVNESTRISVRVIAALEKDDLEGASGPIYARGFVRTLASFYDLDPEWLGAKLDALAGETSRPVLPVDNSDGVIAGPIDTPSEAKEEVDATPKWEVESTRVRKVGASSGGKVPTKLVAGLIGALVVAIALVWILGRGGAPETASSGSQDTLAQVTPQETSEDSIADDTDPGNGAADGNDEVTGSAGATTPAGTRTDPPQQQPGNPADTPRGTQRDAAGANTGGAQEDSTPADEPTTRDADPVPPPAERVEERPEDTGAGLPSVVRPSATQRGAEMELRVVASAPVEVTLSADGGRSETRMLQAGQAWSMAGKDHFSLAVSDPAAISLEMDARPRSLPADWSGAEWIVYPRPAPVDRGGND